MKKFSANEKKLKQELKKQKTNIEHLNYLKNGYLHEIEEKSTLYIYMKEVQNIFHKHLIKANK